jgi:hypothetical protein
MRFLKKQIKNGAALLKNIITDDYLRILCLQ